MTVSGNGAATPSTKAARQERIAAILSREQVHSQEQLAELLERYAGMHVAQATLSRDLDELGVVRLRAGDGSLVYALPGEPGGPGSRPGIGFGAHNPDSRERATPSPDLPAPPAGSSAPSGPSAPSAQSAASAPPGSARGASPASAEPADGNPFGPVPLRLLRHLRELLISAEASANLVVLRTPAGAAQFLASILDHAAWPAVLGTVAGDDTVLVITRDPLGGDALAAEMLRLAQQRR